MFETATLSNADAGRRAWTTGLGFVGEAILVAFVALVPVIWPEVLPKPQALLMLLTPPAPVAPPPMTAVKPRTSSTPVARLHFDPTTIPRSIPTTINMTPDDPPTVSGGIPSLGVPNGAALLISSIIGNVSPVHPSSAVVRPPEVKPHPEPAVPKRIRTSSLELARLVRRVEPVYPPIAKLAHVSGVVELTGIIGTDGHIRELKALSGNPLLIKAALDAVSQWIYAPPVLNGERVEVIAPITVNFRLDH